VTGIRGGLKLLIYRRVYKVFKVLNNRLNMSKDITLEDCKKACIEMEILEACKKAYIEMEVEEGKGAFLAHLTIYY